MPEDKGESLSCAGRDERDATPSTFPGGNDKEGLKGLAFPCERVARWAAGGWISRADNEKRGKHRDGVKTEVTGADETVIATGPLSSHSLSCDHPALAAEITEAREAALPEVIRRTDEVRSFTCPFLHSSLPPFLPRFLPSFLPHTFCSWHGPGSTFVGLRDEPE